MSDLATRKFTTFIVIWFGQVVSTLGSAITGFVFGIWIYERHHSVTEFGVYSFVNILPLILVSPFVGVLVDRWNRRSAMLVSDVTAAVSTLGLWLLLVTGHLHEWEVFVASGMNSALRGLQWPAYSAATTALVPKQHFGRASGMISIGEGLSRVAAPIVAGALLGLFAIDRIVLLDLLSFGFAIVTLAVVRIPQPTADEQAKAETPGSFWQQMTFGWSYLRERGGLLRLQLFLAASNLTENLVIVLITPLVLSFAGKAALGRVMSIGSLGLLAGAILMSVWGGPRRRVRGLFALFAVRALVLYLAALQFNVGLVAAAAFVFSACIELTIGTLQTIWLKKVPSAVQGRVFALRQMIATSTIPIAYLMAGPLADYVFEPLMTAHGPLAGSFGRLIGTGPGRGIALLFLVLGTLNLVLIALASLSPRLMRVEDELPDAIDDAVIRTGVTHVLEA
ncbi:MAG TPA: MFS transporter [Polyangia bacterium]|jgi:MFS family permease|nr:MFS transporter [Polyangia bacterium]